MENYSDRSQRHLQVGSFFTIDISISRRCDILTNAQRATMPAMVGEGSLASPIRFVDNQRAREGSPASPIIILDDDSEGEARVAPRVPNQAAAAPAPPVRGGTCRFRGLALELIGQLFPNARFEIHRIGFPNECNMSPVGSDLVAFHALIDIEALFRVTMIQCDTPGEPEGPVFWSKTLSLHNGLTADEYCNILKLGQPGLGNMILYTFRALHYRSWGLFRQVPGRDYTLDDAFNIMQIPHMFRGATQGFGANIWTNDQRMPRLYICKDMSFEAVKSKITNFMRA